MKDESEKIFIDIDEDIKEFVKQRLEEKGFIYLSEVCEYVRERLGYIDPSKRSWVDDFTYPDFIELHN